jgi:hypothetical protein
VLTKVTAYNPMANLAPLVFNVINRPDTDLFEVRNIDGLGAVKADVNTTPLGSVDRESFVGSTFGKRNIVLTLGMTPDWDDWTVSRLRRLLDRYFMPKFQTHLVFESMEFSPVEIFGYIESNEPNMFSKDPEHQISIICPNPDFTSVASVVINGQTDFNPLNIEYEGNLETGFNLLFKNSADPDPKKITISNTYLTPETFVVDNGAVAIPLDPTHEFMMNSIPGDKYVKLTGAPGVNYLQKVAAGSEWLVLKPGTNIFQVQGDLGVHPWTLTYFEHFGSL